MSVQSNKVVVTTTTYKSGSVSITIEEGEAYTNYILNLTGSKVILCKDEMRQLVDVLAAAWGKE